MKIPTTEDFNTIFEVLKADFAKYEGNNHSTACKIKHQVEKSNLANSIVNSVIISLNQETKGKSKEEKTSILAEFIVEILSEGIRIGMQFAEKEELERTFKG